MFSWHDKVWSYPVHSEGTHICNDMFILSFVFCNRGSFCLYLAWNYLCKQGCSTPWLCPPAWTLGLTVDHHHERHWPEFSNGVQCPGLPSIFIFSQSPLDLCQFEGCVRISMEIKCPFPLKLKLDFFWERSACWEGNSGLHLLDLEPAEATVGEDIAQVH